MSQAVVIICTRPESGRLPRKVFRNICGLPVIEHILRRITKNGSRPFYPIILAVPKGCNSYDHLKDAYPISIYKGNAESPLHRMAGAYLEHKQSSNDKCRYVVRITHDDMLIDSRTMVDLVEGTVRENAGYGISPSIIDGAGVEVILGDNLLGAAQRHTTMDVEHISYFVKGDAVGIPNKTIYFGEVRDAIERPYRLTIDYEEDAQVIEAVLRALGSGPTPSLDDICHYLDRHQELTEYNRMPEVTFYTCAKDAGLFVDKAISSVLTNMGVRKSPSEYILVDDASQDDTLARMITTKRGDDRVRILSNPTNQGLASSSNLAMSKARGKYVMRVDADDYLLPRAFATMRQEMDATGAAIVYANYNTIDADGKIIDRNVPGALHKHAGCALMNLKLINEIKFREGLRHWDGLDLFKRVREHFPVAYVEEPLWLYTVRKDSMSNTKQDERGFIKRMLGL